MGMRAMCRSQDFWLKCLGEFGGFYSVLHLECAASGFKHVLHWVSIRSCVWSSVVRWFRGRFIIVYGARNPASL